MPRRLDWYPWFPRAWATDEGAQLLTAAQRGIYREMLDIQFENDSVPDSPVAIARLSGCQRREVERAWLAVRKFFVVLPDGRLENPHLAAILREQDARREKLVEAGKAGAAKRWDSNPNGDPNGDPIASRVEESRVENKGTNVPSPKVGGTRVRPTPPPAPTFGDHEPAVAAFVAVVAGANASGTIAESRIGNIRRALGEIETQYGTDALAYGLSEATAREKPSVGYVKAVAKAYGTRAGDFKRPVADDDDDGPMLYDLLDRKATGLDR